MQSTFVWGLYENHSGGFSRLVGIFSRPNLAKSCKLIQPLLTSNWQHRDIGPNYIWIAHALDPEDTQESFYFSVEEIQVDRLVED